MTKGIIYLIIAVVFIIIQATKKSKKAQGGNIPPQNPTPATPDTWTEVLRELGRTTTGQPQAFPTDAPEEMPAGTGQEEITQETMINAETGYTQPEFETNSNISEGGIKELTPISDSEIGGNEYNFNDPETLKKAVVYSEILNKKYC